MPQKSDGYRILVDRLWPRGLSKEKAAIDLWLKEIAPSNDLRKWFNHKEKKWPEFLKKYRKELEQNPEPVNRLKQILHDHEKVCFLFAANNVHYNNAVALKSVIGNW